MDCNRNADARGGIEAEPRLIPQARLAVDLGGPVLRARKEIFMILLLYGTASRSKAPGRIRRGSRALTRRIRKRAGARSYVAAEAGTHDAARCEPSRGRAQESGKVGILRLARHGGQALLAPCDFAQGRQDDDAG